MRSALGTLSLSLACLVGLGAVGCGGEGPSAAPSVSLVSSSAQGPMQFMPATWAAYGRGGDVHDPRDAIPAAARYLRAHGAPHDMTSALYAYNHSTSYVSAVRAYAGVMRRWPRSLRGYRAWGVLYRAESGVWVLPTGYPRSKAIYLAAD